MLLKLDYLTIILLYSPPFKQFGSYLHSVIILKHWSNSSLKISALVYKLISQLTVEASSISVCHVFLYSGDSVVLS